MSVALTSTRGFLPQHRGNLIVSVIGHGLLLLMLSSSLMWMPRTPPKMLAIQAVVVDESALNKVSEAERQKTEQAQQREREAAEQQQRREQEQRKAEQLQQQEKAASERRQQEQQRKEAEARVVEQRKQEQAAAERQKAEAERKEQERRAAEEQARQEQERRKAEAEAKAKAEAEAAAKAKAEAEQREQARRQAELMAAMEAEESLLAAQSSGELARYLALIQQKVVRNWVRPPTARAGLECEVAVVQLPNGDVVDARTVSCNGDAAVQRSIENAVRRSSPLPLPDNRMLFERNLRFIFKPEQ